MGCLGPLESLIDGEHSTWRMVGDSLLRAHLEHEAGDALDDVEFGHVHTFDSLREQARGLLSGSIPAGFEFK